MKTILGAALALVLAFGCNRPATGVTAQRDNPTYTACCEAKICYDRNPCFDSGPRINCLGQCFPTFFGCLGACGVPE